MIGDSELFQVNIVKYVHDDSACLLYKSAFTWINIVNTASYQT